LSLATTTVQSITTRDGLASGLVSALLQDRRGFLWLGVPEGLVRLDGLELTTFDRRNTPGFQSHNVGALAEDPRGFLWVGTGGGGLLRFDDERMESVPQSALLPHPEISALHVTPGGDLWIGTRGGLCRLRGEALRCFGEADGLPSAWIGGETGAPSFQALASDKRGALWVATAGGLARQRGQRFERLELAPGENPTALRLDAEGQLWAGTNRGRIVRLDERGLLPVLDLGSSVLVSALLPEPGGRLWFGTTGNGVGLWDGQRIEWLTRRHGLPADQVVSMLADREGNVWIGTFLGVARLSDALISQLGERHGLVGSSVVGLASGRQGLWAVTDEGGLHLFDGTRFAPVSGGRGQRPGDVRRVLEARDGTVWVGTRDGLYRWRDGRLVEEAPELAEQSIIALLEDRAGGLWVGTTNGGLFQRTGEGWRHWTVSTGLPDRGVYTILQARDDSFWIGTRKGLAHLQDGRMRAYGEAEGLPDPLVVALHEDEEGNLWLGTVSGGLVRFRDGRFVAVQEVHGLPDNTVWAILEDRLGYFWLSSNRGISRVARAELEAFARGERGSVSGVRYGPAEGLLQPDCIGGFLSAGVTTADGKLCFATTGGVALIQDPSRATSAPEPPATHIVSARVGGVPHPLDGVLRLAAGSRRLEVRVAAPTFVSPEGVQLRQRLVGFEDDWSPVGRRREVTYTNLPPGELTLEVAASRDGRSFGQPARLALSVEPRWFQTIAFRILAVLVLVFVGPSFYWYRLRQAQRRERELARVVAERTEELRVANLTLVERNAQLAEASLADPLTGLANRRRFDAALAEEWRRAVRAGTWVSLVMADVDAFKQYNDALGHPAGDACLQALAEVLARTARRAGEIAARIGGEEFCLLLPGAAPEAMQAVAHKLREGVEALGRQHPTSPVAPVVTVSVGGASARADLAGEAARLLAAADEALYAAKQRGRNQVVTRLIEETTQIKSP
jgi:diguanylate cyclase (GGDEF)-like protein